jgi:hypothetical protein
MASDPERLKPQCPNRTLLLAHHLPKHPDAKKESVIVISNMCDLAVAPAEKSKLELGIH